MIFKKGDFVTIHSKPSLHWKDDFPFTGTDSWVGRGGVLLGTGMDSHKVRYLILEGLYYTVPEAACVPQFNNNF